MHTPSRTRYTRSSIRRLELVVPICTAMLPSPALAHDFTITDVLVVFKSNGTYQIDMTVDADALALGASSSTPSAELAERLRAMTPDEFDECIRRASDTIQRRVRIRFDGEKEMPSVTFPDHEIFPVGGIAEPTVLGTIARLTGRIPAAASEFTFGASRIFNAIHVTILDQSTATGVKHVVGIGADSPPFRLGEPAQVMSRIAVAAQYLVLGFEHILPRGLDHILFVLGLFLLSPRMRPLLWQVTAFTIAHSVTLALAMYEVVSLPARFVESMIALSIAYVAIENVLTGELKPWRPVVVFCFGLLHGLGFAGVLRGLGLPRNEFVTALVTFNVGVELGQLSVILAAFVTVGLLRRHPRYRRFAVVPASVTIALVGLYWAASRAMFGV